MKVCFAWLDLADPTDRGIAESLARELRALGHSVCFVGPRRRAGEPFRQVVGGVAVYRVGPAKDLAVSQLLRIHSREAVDVWHCHVFARDHGPFTHAARLARWPQVVTLHLVLEDYLPFLGGVRGLRGLIGTSQAVTLASRSQRGEFLRLCPAWRGPAPVVYYGSPGPRAAAPLPEGVRKPYVLSVARLAPYKGQDLLLMAFAKVLEKRPDLRLVLCGRDQMNGGIQRFIRALGLEGRVTLTGGVSPRRVQGLIKGCEFLVLPSRRENFPLVLLEAMAAGEAVLASATGGIPEMLRDGKDGLLVPPNDVEALARGMLELCGDPSLRRRLGRRAKLRSRAFSWRRAAAAYSRLYAHAVRSPAPRG